MQIFQRGQVAHFHRQSGELIAVQIEFLSGEGTNLGRQASQQIVGKAEPLDLGERPDGGRQIDQLIIGQPQPVKEVRLPISDGTLVNWLLPR